MSDTIKWIYITFSDGRVFRIKAGYVAKAYAEYYVGVDPTTTYKEEFDYAMSENFELIEWINNNMDWKDVTLLVEHVEHGYVDLAKEFCNADKEVREDARGETT